MRNVIEEYRDVLFFALLDGGCGALVGLERVWWWWNPLSFGIGYGLMGAGLAISLLWWDRHYV